MLLTKRQLSVVAFASSEPARPTLNGVHVAPDGTCTATDGHRMMRFGEGAPADPVQVPATGLLIPSKAARELAKAIPNNGTVATLPILGHARLTSVTAERCAFVTTDLDATQGHDIRQMPGPFPHVDQVIPKGKPIATVYFNAEYMAELCAAIAKATDDFTHQVRLDVYSGLGAMKLSAASEYGEVLAVLMPQRGPEAP